MSPTKFPETLRIAIDSTPLTSSHLDCHDHAGQQVFGPTTYPLTHPHSRDPYFPEGLAAQSLSTSSDGCLHTFKIHPDLLWSDGTKVTAEDYADRINEVRHQYPKTAESYWISHIKSVECDENTISVSTSAPDFLLPYTLSMFTFSPKPKNKNVSLGAYFVRQANHAYKNEIVLERNPFFPGPKTGDSFKTLRFLHVKEPLRNRELYFSGTIDVTADTAYPYECLWEDLVTPDLHVSPAQMFIALQFEGSLVGAEKHGIREILASVIDRISIAQILHHAILPTINFMQPTRWEFSAPVFEKPRCTEALPDILDDGLILAFDDCPPSYSIGKALQKQFYEHGIRVSLERNSRPDMRLQLVKGLQPTDVSIYTGLFFLEVLKHHPLVQKEYLKEILHLREARHSEDKVKATLRRLQGKLDQIRGIVPLFALSSFTLSRIGSAGLTVFHPKAKTTGHVMDTNSKN